MNELIFFSHLAVIIALIFGAVRLGKEALMILIALFTVLANAFILKEMTLFGLNVTCTDCYAVGSLLSLNLLQQYHGKEVAKQMVNRSFFVLGAFSLLSMLHLLYNPSKLDVGHNAFVTILSHSPRIVIASLATFFVIQRFDVAFFGWLKKIMPKAPLFLPIVLSLLITQSIDTLMFSFLGLYGIVHRIWDIVIISMIVKCIAILFTAPIASLSKWVVKRA